MNTIFVEYVTLRFAEKYVLCWHQSVQQLIVQAHKPEE